MKKEDAQKLLGHVFCATGDHGALGPLNRAVALAIDIAKTEEGRQENIVFLILSPSYKKPAVDCDIRSAVIPFLLAAQDIPKSGDYDEDFAVCYLSAGRKDGQKAGQFNVYYDEGAIAKFQSLGHKALEEGLLFYGQYQLPLSAVGDLLEQGLLVNYEFDLQTIMEISAEEGSIYEDVLDAIALDSSDKLQKGPPPPGFDL